MLAAIKGIDIVVLIDADRRDIGVELHAGRELRPVVLDLIAVAVGSEYRGHGGSSPIAKAVPTDYRSLGGGFDRGPWLPKSSHARRSDGRFPPLCGERKVRAPRRCGAG